jgi:hypothetical protein
VTAERPFVYASMRKYSGADKAWGEFSPIKLWLILPDDTIDLSCTIHYTNDMERVHVDENYYPKSSYLYYSTDVDMRYNAELKRPDTLWIGNTKLIDSLTYNNSTRT